MNDKLNGRLNYWNNARGFGFVNRVVDGNLLRYFLHASQIASGEPVLGSTVRFHAGQTAKGLTAESAEIVPPNDATQTAAHQLADALAQEDGLVVQS